MNPQTSNENYSPNDIISTLEGEPLPFRKEGFYMLNTKGETINVGCEILLGIQNPREYLDGEGLSKEERLQRKEKTLRDGILAARKLKDKPMVSINVDGDWATYNNVTRFFNDPNNNLPENVIIELTEVEKIGNKAARALAAIGLQHGSVLFDDMPTDKSMENMRTMFELTNEMKINYGVKIDFNVTHALLGRPRSGNLDKEYKNAIESLNMLRELINTSKHGPSWIIFEGLNFEDELVTVINKYAPILDSNTDTKAIVLGQFFRDEVKTRLTNEIPPLPTNK